LACVNIIKSTSTMRCRRQSVFDIERTNRQSLGSNKSTILPSVLLKPIKRFWTSQLNEKKKDAVAFFREFFVRPIDPNRDTLFSRMSFFPLFLFGFPETLRTYGRAARSPSSSGPLHLNIYVRCACEKGKRRLGIECAHVEGQTVVQSLKRVVRGKRECLLWDS